MPTYMYDKLFRANDWGMGSAAAMIIMLMVTPILDLEHLCKPARRCADGRNRQIAGQKVNRAVSQRRRRDGGQ